jgi:hypothetical protein
MFVCVLVIFLKNERTDVLEVGRPKFVAGWAKVYIVAMTVNLFYNDLVLPKYSVLRLKITCTMKLNCSR